MIFQEKNLNRNMLRRGKRIYILFDFFSWDMYIFINPYADKSYFEATLKCNVNIIYMFILSCDD